jgi:hypothetical protein
VLGRVPSLFTCSPPPAPFLAPLPLAFGRALMLIGALGKSSGASRDLFQYPLWCHQSSISRTYPSALIASCRCGLLRRSLSPAGHEILRETAACRANGWKTCQVCENRLGSWMFGEGHFRSERHRCMAKGVHMAPHLSADEVQFLQVYLRVYPVGQNAWPSGGSGHQLLRSFFILSTQ